MRQELQETPAHTVNSRRGSGHAHNLPTLAMMHALNTGNYSRNIWDDQPSGASFPQTLPPASQGTKRQSQPGIAIIFTAFVEAPCRRTT
jgi:hypothetical protein